MHRWSCLLLLALLACLLSPGAKAGMGDCSMSGSPASGSNNQLGSPNIPRDLPVGAAIASTRTALNWTFSCKSTAIAQASRWVLKLEYAANPTAVTGMSNVYTSTSFPAGIGFRVVDASNNALPLGSVAGQANAFDMGAAAVGQTSFKWTGAVELIKISPTPAAGRTPLALTPTVPSQAWGNASENGSYTSFTWYIDKTAMTTCNVINATQTVMLPQVSQQALTGSNVNAGATPFSIALQCQKGNRLYITMTDANYPDKTLNLLFPKGGIYGLAAVKIVRGDGTRVAFGPDSSAAGTTNQWFVGDTPEGLLNVLLVASYQTYSKDSGAVFPAGTFSVAATFTLSYQ